MSASERPDPSGPYLIVREADGVKIAQHFSGGMDEQYLIESVKRKI
jgi:hypothetical protein